MSCPVLKRVGCGRARRALLAAATAVVWAGPGPAQAASWTAGSGSWSVAGNWSPIGVPLPGDYATIVHNDAVNRLVTFDFNYAEPLGQLIIDQTGSGTTTFSMSDGTIGARYTNIDEQEVIGLNGRATLLQSGGTNTGLGTYSFYHQVHLGENPGSAGTYNLSGGTLLSAGLYAGYSGSGTFIQSGGLASISFMLFGVNSGSTGAGTLSGGTFIVGALFAPQPYGGTGQFNQIGGTSHISQLVVASFGGSAGTYSLSGGTCNVSLALISGLVNQTGGTATVSTVNLSGSPSSPGTWALGGGSFTVTDSLNIGASGQGMFVTNGVSFISPSTTIGGNSSGSLILNGATHVTSNLVLGSGTSGIGTVPMNNATLIVNGDLTVGGSGQGTLIVGAGESFSMGGGVLTVGANPGGAGIFSITNKVISPLFTDVALDGNGTMTQNGGTHLTSRLSLGVGIDTTGVYTLNNGTLITATQYLGGLGVGIFNHNGGQNIVGNSLTMSDGYPFGCVYNMTAGTVSAVDFFNRFGTFAQTGGVATFSHGISGFGTLEVSGTGKLYTSRIDQSAANVGTGGLIAISSNGVGLSSINYLRHLSLAGTGKFDLSNNHLVIDYGGIPITSETMRNYIASAYAGGDWTGSGLTSSAAAAQANSAHPTALGYAQATDLFDSFPALWMGTVIREQTLLVRYTFAGDANLDGMVDLRDLHLLAGHWLSQADWFGGDFNYDGFVDKQDLTFISRNWQEGTDGQAPPFGDLLASLHLPEPAGLGLVLMSLAALLVRHRKFPRPQPCN